MEKEEPISRIKSAIPLLMEGHYFKVGELTLGHHEYKQFTVAGATHNNYLENVTKQSAEAELQDIKALFSKMVNAAPELNDFILDKQIEYSLWSDYGKGSIEICSEKDGQIKWKTRLIH